MDRLLRIEEVSEATGIPIRTLRTWRANREGPPAARLGRRVVYRARDVDAWIAEQFAKDAAS